MRRLFVLGLLLLLGCGGSSNPPATLVGSYSGIASVLKDGVVQSSGNITGTVFSNGIAHFAWSGPVSGSLDGSISLVSGSMSNATVTWNQSPSPQGTAGTLALSQGTYTLKQFGWLWGPVPYAQASISAAMNKN